VTGIFEAYAEIIPDFTRFQEAIHRPLPTHIRINRLKIKPGSLRRLFEENGIRLKRAIKRHDALYLAPDVTSPGNLLHYFLGYIHPQALTSALASLALCPREDSYVLDMCAAPGGKSAHCADLMNNTGLIISNDLYATRHRSLGHTLDRLGILNTVTTDYQAQEFPLKHRFDYVLADVPCSGEGGFRKTRATSQYREDKGKIRLPELQRGIILRGFDLLKDKGEMLYSTCTYNPDENESVVDFLLQSRDAELLAIDVGLDFEPGMTEWRGRRYDTRLRKAARFYPHRIDSVGFFMAKIGRRK